MLRFNKERLAWELNRQDMSTAELARRTGLKGNRGYEFFQTAYSPGLRTIGRIADALGIDGRELIREVYI